jgi:hypothetical protein
MSKLHEYLKHEQACRAMADNVRDELTRKTLLAAADAWRLLRSLEERPPHPLDYVSQLGEA